MRRLPHAALSLVLCFCFAFSLISLKGFSAENLVSSDTSHFDYEYITPGDSDYTSYTPSSYVYSGHNCFRYPTAVTAGRMYIVSDLTGKIYSGKTYEFSVDLWFTPGFSQFVGNVSAHVAIFSGSWSSYTDAFSSSSSTTLARCELFEIDCDYPNSPWNTHFDYGTVSSTFTVPNLTGTYSAFLVFGSVAEANTSSAYYLVLGVDNMKLIDVNDNSEQLDGIKGFLHNIFWDLRGGDCGESCSPHTSLSDRIGQKFTAAISSVSTWLSGLGDRVSGFFTDLKTNLVTHFSNLGDRISGFFLDLKNSLVAKLDGINQFFDKFKPRVYFDLRWLRNRAINSNGGSLLVYPDGGAAGSNRAVVTDYFYISSGVKYYLDFGDFDGYLAVAKYNNDCTFISMHWYTTLTSYELPSGYCYRFMFSSTDFDFREVEDVSGFCNARFRLYCDEGFMSAAIHSINIKFRQMFLPSEGYFLYYRSEFEQLCSDHLGFIYQAPDLFKELVTSLRGIVTSNSGTPHFTLPALSWSLNGQDYNLWSDTPVDMSFLSSGVFSVLYGMYKVILNVILIFSLIRYGSYVLERRILDN